MINFRRHKNYFWKKAVLSDKIVVLKEGEVLVCGETKDVMNNKELLNSSNLELLLPLKLLYKMEENNLVNEKVKDILWQLSLNK